MPDPGSEALALPVPPASLPMYAAAWVVAMCGLYAVNAVLDEPSFANLTFVLATVGFTVSYISRRQGLSQRSIHAAAWVAFAAVCVVAVAGGPALSLLLPVSAGDDKGRTFAVFLTWAVVVSSYALSSESWLLFQCVFTLALIGLVGSQPVDAPLVVDFVVFLAAAAFMMVHENFLRTKVIDTPRLGRPRSGALLASQAVLAGACIAGSMAGAYFIAAPIRAIGSYLSLSVGLMPARAYHGTPLPTRPHFDETEERQVGTGPVNLSDQIVMKVRTDYPTYLRGGSFDDYTGRGWRSQLPEPADVYPTDSGKRDAPYQWHGGDDSEQHRFTLTPTVYTASGPSSRRVEQDIHLQGAVFNEIYAAAEPRQIDVFQYRLQVDEAGNIHPAGALQGQSYTVVSSVPTTDAGLLRKATADVPAQIAERYLGVGPDGQAADRLEAEARRITAGLRTQYDKVEALRGWVSAHCKYNLNAPAVPAGQDVATYFLFTSREGYCDLFATSLAMLCRALRIPARVATGFTSGDQDESAKLWLVRERHKHMWTEVYFAGQGWVPFDAVEGSEDITSRSGPQTARRSSLAAFLFGRGVLPPVALLTLLAMVGFVLKVEVLDRLLRSRRGESSSPTLPATNLEIVHAYQTTCARLAGRGWPRTPAQTPVEYLLRVQAHADAAPELIDALQLITTLCVRYRYSSETASPTDVEAARAAASRARAAMRGLPRHSPVVAPAQVEG